VKSFTNSKRLFILQNGVVKLIDFIFGYVTGMVITFLAIAFFMGANQERGDY